MRKLKEILCDVLDYAYSKSSQLNDYKKFYIVISPKTTNSKQGEYLSQKHKIVIFNPYRDDISILLSIIHELSHHIDFMNKGTIGHNKSFYDNYTKLLYAMLDMNLIKTSDLKNVKLYSNKEEIKKINEVVSTWKPSLQNKYNKGFFTISVYHCFDKKDLLKTRGYTFNKKNNAWQIDVNCDKRIIEQNFLSSNGFNKYFINNVLNLNKYYNYLIKATGNTYKEKTNLKNDGFKWLEINKGHCSWVIKMNNENQLNFFQRKYPTLNFSIYAEKKEISKTKKPFVFDQTNNKSSSNVSTKVLPHDSIKHFKQMNTNYKKEGD